MARGKIADNSARLATVVPKELAEYITYLADKEVRSTSQFLAMFLTEHFGVAAAEYQLGLDKVQEEA